MLTKVKAVRLTKGYTQMQLVERTGGILNQYRISVIERGVRPRPDEAIAIAYALDVSEQELFPEQKSEK